MSAEFNPTRGKDMIKPFFLVYRDRDQTHPDETGRGGDRQSDLGTLEQARPDIESCQSPDSVFALEHM